MGLLRPNWRPGLQPRISNLRNLPMGLARDRFAFRADWFRNCIENPVLAAERRPGGRVAGWRRGWAVCGSGEPELLFLVHPDCRQVANESSDGEIGRGSTLGDRLDDARGEIGERRQEPNVPLGQVLPFRDRPNLHCRVFDEHVDPSS